MLPKVDSRRVLEAQHREKEMVLLWLFQCCLPTWFCLWSSSLRSVLPAQLKAKLLEERRTLEMTVRACFSQAIRHSVYLSMRACAEKGRCDPA